MDDVRRRMKGIFYIGRGSISRGADATTSKVAVGSRSRRTSGTITALILGSERSPRATAPRLTQVRLEKEQVTEVKATDASRSGVHHQECCSGQSLSCPKRWPPARRRCHRVLSASCSNFVSAPRTSVHLSF